MPRLRGLEALLRAARNVSQMIKRVLAIASDVFVRLATLPYYRLYHFNTSDPLARIARLASEPEPNTKILRRAISAWRLHKLSELQFITIACTVLAAAVIGAFSWTTLDNAYWLTYGFWHSSLMLSILGILLSASEITVLSILGPLNARGKVSLQESRVRRYTPFLLSTCTQSGGFMPRRKMVFAWQCPLMFMSYSVCAFLAGLTILVCTPFIREKSAWGDGHNIATMYLAIFAGGATAFVFCSYWVWHYMDLEYDANDGDDSGEDIGDLTSREGSGPALNLYKIPLEDSMPSASYSAKSAIV